MTRCKQLNYKRRNKHRFVFEIDKFECLYVFTLFKGVTS